MAYRLVVKKQAKKFIGSLPMPDRKRIAEALRKLPEEGDIKKLQGHDSLFRLRVGAYRIIYTVDNGELVVIVVDAGNRGQIYNKY